MASLTESAKQKTMPGISEGGMPANKKPHVSSRLHSARMCLLPLNSTQSLQPHRGRVPQKNTEPKRRKKRRAGSVGPPPSAITNPDVATLPTTHDHTDSSHGLLTSTDVGPHTQQSHNADTDLITQITPTASDFTRQTDLSQKSRILNTDGTMLNMDLNDFPISRSAIRQDMLPHNPLCDQSTMSTSVSQVLSQTTHGDKTFTRPSVLEQYIAPAPPTGTSHSARQLRPTQPPPTQEESSITRLQPPLKRHKATCQMSNKQGQNHKLLTSTATRPTLATLKPHWGTLSRPTPSSEFTHKYPHLALLYNTVTKARQPNNNGARQPANTTFDIKAWAAHLQDYHDELLIPHLTYGFPLGFATNVIPTPNTTNHASTMANPKAVDISPQNFHTKHLLARSQLPRSISGFTSAR